MNGILIYPNSKAEKSLIEELLSKMNISFKETDNDKILLGKSEIQDIKEGLTDVKNNDIYTQEEIEKLMDECSK